MIEKIKIILDMWHEHFSNKEHQYSEFEKSDIEYFVGCLLYNHFKFSKALDTMKTMDLSYDFISECGNEYDEVLAIVETINYDDELEALEVLQNFISESIAKYNADESYLLKRMQNHINAMAERYNTGQDTKGVVFTTPKAKSRNPLDNI
jgi:hypothetical protein